MQSFAVEEYIEFGPQGITFHDSRIFDCRQKNKHNFGETVPTETIVSLIYLFFNRAYFIYIQRYIYLLWDLDLHLFSRWHRKISPLHPGAIYKLLQCAHINNLSEKIIKR